MLALGKYSYSIYLLHYALDWAVRGTGMHPVTAGGTADYALLLGAAAFGCALVTWTGPEERSIRFGRSIEPANGAATRAA
jgi:peptidoglycan/LPS O-acetylase OafA/YrhL